MARSKEEILSSIEFALRYSIENYILLENDTILKIRKKAKEIYAEVEDRVLEDNQLKGGSS